MTEQMEPVRLLDILGSLRAASFSTAILRAGGRKIIDGRFHDRESLAFIATGMDRLRQQVLSQRVPVLQ